MCECLAVHLCSGSVTTRRWSFQDAICVFFTAGPDIHPLWPWTEQSGFWKGMNKWNRGMSHTKRFRELILKKEWERYFKWRFSRCVHISWSHYQAPGPQFEERCLKSCLLTVRFWNRLEKSKCLFASFKENKFYFLSLSLCFFVSDHFLCHLCAGISL